MTGRPYKLTDQAAGAFVQTTLGATRELAAQAAGMSVSDCLRLPRRRPGREGTMGLRRSGRGSSGGRGGRRRSGRPGRGDRLEFGVVAGERREAGVGLLPVPPAVELGVDQDLLRVLGLPAPEAESMCRRPLPEVDDIRRPDFAA